MRAAIGRVDKEQLVSVRDVMTLEDVAWDATARHRFRAVMVMTFAALALLLAMVGVFGILAYSVQQRVRDFARAAGARRDDAVTCCAWSWRSAVRVMATGGVGWAGAVGDVGPPAGHDAVRRPAAGRDDVRVCHVVLAVTAALAVAGPAWRATRIDPAAALRTE